ncbi:unnamed protein product [Plutella xylostella]|uniref:(diamondback moth) hypothetical protein n=1 Tax=Plutella xylostella TaxID=51655 RepID=A0A8S4DRZ6_PLUXY|nr:unnamed protein product [Plutella xylostella]
MEENNDGDELSLTSISANNSTENLNDQCVQKIDEMCESEITGIQRLGEKRPRNDSPPDSPQIDDDGFTTVVRRSPKRLARSFSNNPSSPILGESNDYFEVCITSKNILPKQIALAKLLRSENFDNILRIKFKSPYRVLIQLRSKREAERLMSCTKLENLGYRCQMTNELNLSYGLLRDFDLDADLKELTETLKCEYEIVSLKRLKRLDTVDGWTECESVRICFRSTTLPPFVKGYGCRFKVEPYIFPVTQCAGCWKYGHYVRVCPTKKIICPKCAGEHNNCEAKVFSCVNCKGNHMAMNKKCPIFMKERQIRETMSKNNCTYRKALNDYLSKTEKEKELEQIPIVDHAISRATNNSEREKSYRDVVVGQVIVHENS